MLMRYELAPDIESIAKDIVSKLGMSHVDLERVAFVRSRGSKSRRTLARIHGLPRIMQLSMNTGAHYAIEVISENFDCLSEDDRIKTVVHELMHVPKGFGGGFRNHKQYVTRKNVESVYSEYVRACSR